jgi:hypothetical protein
MATIEVVYDAVTLRGPHGGADPARLHCVADHVAAGELTIHANNFRRPPRRVETPQIR